jgi:hypothetical protein
MSKAELRHSEAKPRNQSMQSHAKPRDDQPSNTRHQGIRRSHYTTPIVAMPVVVKPIAGKREVPDLTQGHTCRDAEKTDAKQTDAERPKVGYRDT